MQPLEPSIHSLKQMKHQKKQPAAVKKEKSYFSLDLDDDEDVSYKSQAGQQILGEFTSKFKGLQGF